MRTMIEQEDKFEVDSDWVLPQLTELVPDGGRLDQETRKLDNTYFDTPGAGLRIFGITLRRRVGGSETGWQLKVPSGTARTELQSGSRAKTMPPALGGGVAGLLAGENLDPVATIATTRTAYQILNADGELGQHPIRVDLELVFLFNHRSHLYRPPYISSPTPDSAI